MGDFLWRSFSSGPSVASTMAQQQQQQQQGMPVIDTGREPCPDRILDDIGGAFAMGAVGGGAWHLVKGLRNSPPGFRIRGALEVSMS